MKFSGGKATFLDRDGVINYKAPEGEYIRKWEQVKFIPGVIGAVAQLNDAGYQVFIVTNQRGVALQMVQLQDLLEIHRRIKEEFHNAGAIISDIYCCLHNINEMCVCRKPKPGMLQRAAREYNLDLKSSWMIGDSITDVEAGENAGCRTILLASKRAETLNVSRSTLVTGDLESAVLEIVKFNGTASPTANWN